VDVAAELVEARAGMVAADGDDEGFFYVMVRGGKWTYEAKGVAADACAGKARAGVASTWCKSFKFPRMFSGSFMMYTRERCLEMSREYCRRATYYLRLWLESGLSRGDFKYTQAHVDAYVPHPDWAAYMASVPAGSASHRRALKLDGLKPKLG
jgi:hypothetical protein